MEPSGAIVNIPSCDHSWSYAGVRYRMGHRCAGSSAHEVEYFDAYLCSRCGQRNYVRLPETHDSYQRVRHGATPLESNAQVIA